MAYRSGRIAAARLIPPPEVDWTARLRWLDASLTAGTRIERHRREWVLGPTFQEKFNIDGAGIGVTGGRIGFEQTLGMAEVWNENLEDFAVRAVVRGQTSRFIIRHDDLTIAYQLRPGQIRRGSFEGAFQALLREAGSVDWSVEGFVEDVEWDEYRAHTDRITKLRFVIEEPNPNWRGRRKLREWFEPSNTTRMTVTFESDDPAGLNVDAEAVQESLAHTVELEYGKASAVGADEDATVAWNSKQTESLPEVHTAEVDPSTGEVPWALIAEATEELQHAGHDYEILSDDGDDDRGAAN